MACASRVHPACIGKIAATARTEGRADRGKSPSPFRARAARLLFMNQTELMIAVGGGLFLAFLLGWIAGWLALRAGDPGPSPSAAPAPLTLGAADRMAAAERDVMVARDALREAQIEIEELRSYIDRKLGRRPDEPPAP